MEVYEIKMLPSESNRLSADFTYEEKNLALHNKYGK
jgi:hypothetical protein